jgi:hypothetical protein
MARWTIATTMPTPYSTLVALPTCRLDASDCRVSLIGCLETSNRGVRDGFSWRFAAASCGLRFGQPPRSREHALGYPVWSRH